MVFPHFATKHCQQKKLATTIVIVVANFFDVKIKNSSLSRQLIVLVTNHISIALIHPLTNTAAKKSSSN